MTDAKHLHTQNVEVRWGDMDAMGHVNNATFLTYFEHVRAQWLGIAGWSGQREGVAPVVVRTECDYKAPIEYPATVRVSMAARWDGGKSIETLYEMRDAAQTDRLYATGRAIVVFIDTQKGGAVAPPSAFTELLA